MRPLQRVLVIVGLLCSAAGAFAQAGLGSISGTIQDQTKGRLSGATIQAIDVATGTIRTATSNDTGLFNLANLAPGTYSITITRQDFKTVQFDNVVVNSFQQLSLGEVQMEVAVGASDAIEVTATRPVLDADSGVRFETIQSGQVQDMPIQGRNWSTLLKVIPGSIPTDRAGISGREYSASGYADFTINGKNPQHTQVNLDGGSLVDHGSDAKLTVAPSLESIQEVSVLTNNFQAEYGNRGGTVVNIVTKSGTNQFKGAVFDYLRNEALNANSWSNNFLKLEKSRYRFNYFGGNLGGPIQRNKLFFFYNFENFKQELPGGVLQVRVPTERERNGDFSQTLNTDGTRPQIFMPGTQFSGTPVPLQNNILPQELITPLGRAFMNAFPLPNNPSDPNNNFVMPYDRKFPRHSHTARVDWNINTLTQAYVRYTADGGTQVDRNVGSSGGAIANALIQRPRPDYALAASVNRTFSPTLVMNTLFNWSYDYVEWQAVDPAGISRSAFGLSDLPSVFPVADDVLPQVETGTYGAYQFNRIPAYARANEYQVASTLTWVRGSHVVKGGAQYIRNLKNEIDASPNKGFYDFRPVTGSPSAFDTGYGAANILVGALSRFQQIEQVNHKDSVYNDIHAFAQDTWHVNSRLTLDYGLRFYHIPTEHNRNPEDTLDGVFLPSRWDPAKAPRIYVPDPRNPSRVIDPAFPDAPLPANLSNVLRYTLVPGSGDPNNGLVSFQEAGNTGIANPRAVLFAPRGGFAWSPFGPRTIIRGGFGWAYNRNNIAHTVNDFENALGGSANLAQTSLATLASTTVRPIPARIVAARDETQRSVPTVYDYSVSVQRQLFSDMVVDVAYIGNVQKNLAIRFNLNAIAPGTMFRPEFVDPSSAGFNFAGPISASNPGPALPGSNAMNPLVMRPYRGYDTINMVSNIGTITYNGLQVSASKRLSRNFSFDAAYTLGRTKNEVEGAGLYASDWAAYSGFKGDNDRLHSVTVNYIYHVPKIAGALRFNNPLGRALLDDWKIAHLFAYFTGMDYSPTYNIQQANTTTNVDINRVLLGTPDLTPRLLVNGDPNGVNRDQAHQFDPAVMAVPGIFPAYDGTGDRNFLRGRPAFSNDLSFVKTIRLHNSQRIELRANIYNVFNSARQLDVNRNIVYKARGRSFSDGFTIFNTPEAQVARAQANGVTDPVQLFNTFRTGVGHLNLNMVEPPRIIEIGMAFRF